MVYILYKKNKWGNVRLNFFKKMNVEFSAKIHFCWLEKLSPKETFQKMRDTYVPTSPEESTIYKWFEEFDKGRESIFDLP